MQNAEEKREIALNGAGGIVPQGVMSRTNWINTSVTSTKYFVVRGLQFSPNQANGAVATLQTHLSNGFESWLSREDKKDIQSTDRTDGEDYLTAIWTLLQSCMAQKVIRMMCPSFVGNIDANAATLGVSGDVWTTDDWDTILKTIKSAGLKVPKGLLRIVRLMNPIICQARAQVRLRYKGSYVALWLPSLTKAEAYTLIGLLQTYSEAGNYFRKIGVEMVDFELPDPIRTTVWNNDPYTYWVRQANYVYARNNANGSYIWVGGIGTDTGVLDANILTGFMTSTTWYEQVQMATFPGAPYSDMWALTRLTGTYDGTDNPYGCVQFMDTDCIAVNPATANKVMGGCIAANGTTFTACATADIATDFFALIFAWGNSSANQLAEKNVETGQTVDYLYRFHAMPGEYYTVSSSWMANAEYLLFNSFQGAANFYDGLGSSDKSDSGSTTKSGASGRDSVSSEKDGRNKSRRRRQWKRKDKRDRSADSKPDKDSPNRSDANAQTTRRKK